MANELPEYFDNIVLGQYAMTGVPLKVYANDRYYIIASPEDVDDPLIGYGMTPSGKMEPFDYRDIEHIMVAGNKVDLATYIKALGDELKGVKKAADAKGGEEKEGGEEKKEEGGEEKKSPFESFDPYSKKWSLKSLLEISKEEMNAQEDALKAEMEAGKAKIKAAKDKMNDLKKQPIEESVISDILVIAYESTTYEKFIAELIKQKLLKREDLRDPELVDELKTMYRGQALGKRESVNELKLTSAGVKELLAAIYYNWNKLKTAFQKEMYFKSFKDVIAFIKSGDQEEQKRLEDFVQANGVKIAALESVTENHISEPYIFHVGDIIRNTNPQCKHFGSTGIVQSVMDMDDNVGQLIKYLVTNYGDTFKPGMSLTKTPDQLEPMDDYYDDDHSYEEDEYDEYEIEYGDDWDDEDED